MVGHESVGGADTTHIRAGVNVAALLADLNTFLQKASSLGVPGTANIPGSISDTTRSRIASEVKNPTVDVWTGNGDKTVRKLSIALTVPVSGQVSTLLGGLRSAQIGLSLQYANLNQPQTIQPPASVRPFSEFTTKLRSFLAGVQATTGGGLVDVRQCGEPPALHAMRPGRSSEPGQGAALCRAAEQVARHGWAPRGSACYSRPTS